MKAGTLECRGIRKVYPGTVALDDFSARFEGGMVHALIGKNGSGKSTLIKIFSGAEKPGAGTILVDGVPVALHGPQDAFRQGIATVYQELSLIPKLTVAENIFLGRLPRHRGAVDWRGVRSQARALLDALHVDIDENAVVSSLSVGRQQMVEIAKAMSFDPSVLLLDEPTSALARHETKSLFELVHKLKARGVAVIYITHRLHELPEIADDVTVLRDGKFVGALPICDATPAKIVELMFGKTELRRRPEDLMVGEEIVLAAEGLGRHGRFSSVDLKLRKGEILGIAGMLGSGRSELLRSIFGADPYDSGSVVVGGVAVPPGTGPGGMKARGLAMTPENRKEEGLVQRLSIRANMSLAGMGRIARRGVITKKAESAAAARQVQTLAIKAAHLENPVSSLSGGNQQKVVIGNWLNNEPEILFFDEPTRGIDVQAKQQVFQIMWDLSRKGLSSIFVSTELEELVEVCHRILVMRDGEIVAERDAASVELEELYALCMGDAAVPACEEK